MTTTPAQTEPGVEPQQTVRLRWWLELLMIAAFYAIYSFVRNLFGSQGTGDIDASVAFEHARQIIDLEKSLGLYFEDTIQRWYLDLPSMGFIRVWNIFYGVAHFVVTAGALFWLFRSGKGRYSRWRNTLGLTTAVALVGFASYSLMPPRLLDDPGKYGACQVYAPDAAEAAAPGQKIVEGCDEYGYVDTLAVHGGWISFDDEKAASVTNQYAAMPSMHIGWSVWSMIVLSSLVRRRWLRMLVYLYPVLTLFTIIVTANHYWIDAVGGLLALGTGAALANLIERRRRPLVAV
ncbi:phosphatase PAP2 family protein [Actinospongicola halichondriae]|uniref:phosphatase PAP2 family protein n=1 Tax=Actinospongicola halichondriae TaxID=3236844 RepID=UPI003D5A2B3A